MAKVQGIGETAGKVNVFADSKANEMGIPYAQTPGLGKGNKEVSLNQLPSTARVVKPATSNLMTGMSASRGSGGTK